MQCPWCNDAWEIQECGRLQRDADCTSKVASSCWQAQGRSGPRPPCAPWRRWHCELFGRGWDWDIVWWGQVGAELGECLTTSCGDRSYGAPAHALTTRSCVLEPQPKVLHNAPLKSNESLKLEINQVESIGTIGKYTASHRKNVNNCKANTHIYKNIYKYIFKHIYKKLPAWLLIPPPMSCCTPSSAWPDLWSKVIHRDIELCRARGFLLLQGPGSAQQADFSPGAAARHSQSARAHTDCYSSGNTLFFPIFSRLSLLRGFVLLLFCLCTCSGHSQSARVHTESSSFFFHKIWAQNFSWRVL